MCAYLENAKGKFVRSPHNFVKWNRILCCQKKFPVTVDRVGVRRSVDDDPFTMRRCRWISPKWLMLRWRCSLPTSTVVDGNKLPHTRHRWRWTATRFIPPVSSRLRDLPTNAPLPLFTISYAPMPLFAISQAPLSLFTISNAPTSLFVISNARMTLYSISIGSDVAVCKKISSICILFLLNLWSLNPSMKVLRFR